MTQCAVIQDLLPLYLDDLASAESRQEIEAHLSCCGQCRLVLERMRTPVSDYSPRQEEAFRRVLKKQNRRVTKRVALMTALLLLLAGLIVLAALWFSHAFFYVGSFSSPDGSVTTRVYSRDITEFVPEQDHFTLVDEGDFTGTTVLWGSFDGLWWSANGKYQVVSLLDDGECWLTVFDYVRNTGSNLDNRLRNGIYGLEDFSDTAVDDVEFRFLQWSQYESSMLIYFSYVNHDGLDRDGYFWYSYTDGTVTGVAFLETFPLTGTVKELGEGFYVMDLDEPDENGNVVELVFQISDATRMEGVAELTPGDHIRLVLRGGAQYAARPWEFSFAHTQTEEHPTAISVTLAP